MIEVLNTLFSVLLSDPVTGILLLLALGSITVVKLVQLYRQKPTPVVVDMNGRELVPWMDVLVHHTSGNVMAKVVQVFPDSPTVNEPGHNVDIDKGGGPEGMPSYILEVVTPDKLAARDMRGFILEQDQRVLVYGCAGTNRVGVFNGATHDGELYGYGLPDSPTTLLEISFPDGSIELQPTSDVEALPPVLNFSELSIANIRRCEQDFARCDEWTLGDWGNAMAGEVGEACNIIKKLRRGDTNIEYSDLAKELADVVHYAVLIAWRIDTDLGEAVRNKFNEVSDRVGSDIRL